MHGRVRRCRRRCSGGYRFVHFDHEPQPGEIFLRHDVDLVLDAAVRMAELEAERDVAATYFLMTRSVFYNLDSREGEAALERLPRARASRRAARRPSASRLRRSLRPRARVAQPRPRVRERAGRRARQRDDAAVVRPRPLPLRLEPALSKRRPDRRARARRARLAAALDPSGDLGVRRRDGCARRWSRCSTRSARRGCASSPKTGSTSREADHDSAHGLGLARARRRSCARCARTASATCASSAPT